MGGLEYGVAFNELAAFEAGPGADERDEVGCRESSITPAWPAGCWVSPVGLWATVSPALLRGWTGSRW